ncbi:MAG: stage III sporulation protein AE [Clostridia bacterium]
MKKLVFIVVFLICFCLPFCLPCKNLQSFGANCVAEEDVSKQLEDKIAKQLEDLDLSEFDEYFLQMEREYGTSFGGIKEFLVSITKGEFNGGFNQAFNMCCKIVGKQIFAFIPILICIVAIAILFSLIDGISSNFMSKSTTEIIYFVCYSAIIVLVVGHIIKIIALTSNTINTMQGLMNVIFPILLTLVTALGGVVSVSAYKPMMAVASTVIVSIISKFVMPCFIACIIFCIVGNLSKNIKLEKLTKFLKSTAEVVLGSVFGLFVSFVTVQGLIGSVADNISVKSAKFAISSYVPILGGYLSDGFDLVMASMVLVKNSIGVVGLLIILFIVMLPLIQIVIFLLGLRLASGIVEPICDKRISELLYNISNNLILLVVAILGVTNMFFIMIMLIIYTCNLGVV